MKTVALLLTLLILSSSVNIRRRYDLDSAPFQKLRKVGELSQYGANLISSVELHLSSGGKVDEVIEFVREALGQAQSERSALNTEYQSEMYRLGQEIDGYNHDLETLNTELTATVGNIETLRGDISDLELLISNLEGEIQSLRDRERGLNTARDNDIMAFDARQQRDSRMLGALEEIIPALENLLNGGSAFLQRTEAQILIALKRIPENKPIQALVELSTKFSEVKLREVVQKLSEIFDAVQENKAADEQAELVSKGKYTQLLSEIDTFRTSATTRLHEAEGNLAQKKQALDLAESKKINITQNITSTTTLRDSTQTVKDSSEANFLLRLESAKESALALKAALDILTENEGTLEAQEEKTQSVNEQATS